MIPLPFYISREPYEKQFADSYEKWKEIKKNGANNEVWTDGQVLNLIRSKMIRLKKFIREERGFDDILTGFEIPEKVDFEFMAGKKERSKRRKR